jgi:hypothetical protein
MKILMVSTPATDHLDRHDSPHFQLPFYRAEPAGTPGRHLLFLTGPRDSGSDPGRAAQLFDAFLFSLGVSFYCIEITSEKMRGWMRS